MPAQLRERTRALLVDMVGRKAPARRGVALGPALVVGTGTVVTLVAGGVAISREVIIQGRDVDAAAKESARDTGRIALGIIAGGVVVVAAGAVWMVVEGATP